MSQQALDTMIAAINDKKNSAEDLLVIRRDVLMGISSVTQAALRAGDWKESRESQGIFYFLIGYSDRAVRILDSEASGETGKTFLGLALLAENKARRAAEVLKGLKGRTAQVAYVRALIQIFDLDEADKIISNLEKTASDDPEVMVVRAEHCFRNGEIERASELVEKALQVRPNHPSALFVGAMVAERAGEDMLAISRYESLAQTKPINVSALINLGVMLEDRNEFKSASRCYQAILREYPTHNRAKLYLKEAEASLDMYYDEDRERREDKRQQVLKTPCSDFELSVRSRNCLQKMGIDSLGDLIQRTEAELLAYKNFGETSLQEIKAILVSKGLRLGMTMDEALKATSIDEALERQKPKHEGILADSVDALDLSVRARRCMERMNVKTIGELCEHSEQQLLSAPNFGATSLIEVKRKLSDLGLGLKG